MANNRHVGIEIRHARRCSSRAGATCTCKPTFQAKLWSRRDKKLISKTFPTLAAAKTWRSDAVVALRRGTMKAPSQVTLREAAETWLAGARDGSIRTRSGEVYKPSVLRSYETALRLRILDDLGGVRLSDLTRLHVQDLVDRMLAESANASTIRNTTNPLRAIFRRALSRGDVAVNPTAGVEVPAIRGRRDRIASPSEAAELLGVLSDEDRALWATAMYAGLRRGELQALRWGDVDLDAGVISVERSWDAMVGEITPKSRAGTRTVPIPRVLREHLVRHKLASGRSEGLAFGGTASAPFVPSSVRARALGAWRRARHERACLMAAIDGLILDDVTPEEQAPYEEASGFKPIGLHECRHTFASLAIAAGVNAKALSTYMGHSSITITLDRYGHLMPGNEDEAAVLLDAYLERALAAV